MSPLRVGTTDCVQTRSCLPPAASRSAGGDVCERRLRREKRAKRSGRIKAIGKRAVPAQTEPLIQQIISPPYRDARRYLCLRDGEEGVEVFLFCHQFVEGTAFDDIPVF